MRWDNVVGAAMAALKADSQLTAVVGTHIYMAGERAHNVPSVEWSLAVDSETELMEEMLVQVDLWAYTISDLNTMESRVRRVLDHPVWRTLGGIKMRSQYLLGRVLEGPEDGVLSRSLDFEFEVFKRRFAVDLGSEST